MAHREVNEIVRATIGGEVRPMRRAEEPDDEPDPEEEAIEIGGAVSLF